MKIHRAQFQAKCREFSTLTLLWPQIYFPLTTTAVGFDVTRRVWQTEKQRRMKHKTNSDSSAVCCVLPECLQLLGKLKDCTAASGAQGSLKKPQ